MVKTCLLYLSGFLLLAAVLLYSQDWKWVPYAYAAGAAGLCLSLLLRYYRGKNLRLRRLNTQRAIAGLMLPVSAWFMYRGENEWMVCLLVSAVLQTYVAFVEAYEEGKERKRGNDS